jgi:BarA-like signal transduction histidine kinase
MPILVEASVTKEEVQAAIAAALAKFLISAVPGYTDPKTGKAVSYATAIRRGLTAYDYVAINGPLDKRVGVLEQLLKADAADDTAEALEQDQIKAALEKPILGGG